jgi:hypothetical protein
MLLTDAGESGKRIEAVWDSIDELSSDCFQQRS